MSKAKYTKDEVKNVLRIFTAATYDQYKNHSFAAGWYESVISELMTLVPRHKQAEVIQCLMERAVKCKEAAV